MDNLILLNQPTLGMLIRQERKALKLSQRKLGEYCGLTYQAIANWECGARMPTLQHVAKIAEVFKKDLSVFCQDEVGEVDEGRSIFPNGELAFNLRRYRKLQGYSQIELSSATGLSLAKIKIYENSQSGILITNGDLEAICTVLNVDPDEILGASRTREGLEAAELQRIVDKIEELTGCLNKQGLQRVVDLMTDLCDLQRYRRKS